MENRIKEILSIIFEVDIDQINDDFSSDSTENWDSLRHMNMVTALEEEFGVFFEDEEIVELLNLQLIKVIIEEKIA